MESLEHATLESLEVGPLPVVREIFRRIDLPAILERHLPPSERGRPREWPAARLIELLVENIVVSRQPLYKIADWLKGHAPAAAGFADLTEIEPNDDRFGRGLDRLFYKVDGRALTTDVVVAAVRAFGIRLRQFHDDTTTVTLHGRYKDPLRGTRTKEPPVITFGYNKDHRPDLKQLVFELTTSADGAVPVHFRVHDGNTADDQTHRETWNVLRQFVGSPDFLYVADSKLAVRETMLFIAEQGGRFVSVLPRTRAETALFCERLALESLAWQEVLRRPDPRHPHGPDVVYEGIEGDATSEGFRLLWYRSSQKLLLDQESRTRRIEAAKTQLRLLESRFNRGKLRLYEPAVKAARKIVEDLGVAEFVEFAVEVRQTERFEQEGPGRPGPNTTFKKVAEAYLVLSIAVNPAAVAKAARCDGVFPLVTNDCPATLQGVLRAYKEQPFLERRHEQFKQALAVAPVHLKSPTRIAALLTAYFLALLTMALIEREVRRQMKKHKIASLPLYPEQRLCKQPTAEVVLDAFRGIRRHRLLDANGVELRVFYDPLTPAARTLLDLLGIDPACYGAE